MDISDGLKPHGSLTLVLEKANGQIETMFKDNIVVANGFDFICNSIGASTRPAIMDHIAVGTGTVAAALSDSTLGAELTRLASTYAHTAGTQVMTFTAVFGPGVGTGAITEAAVTQGTVPGAGILLDHVVFPVVNKGANDTLTATFTFTLS